MSDEKNKDGIKSLENIDAASLKELVNGANIRRRNKETKRSKHNYLVNQVKFLRFMGLLPNSHLKMVLQV